MSGRLRIAMVGLGFGSHLVPIYRAHADVATVGLCDGNAERLQSMSRQNPGLATHASLDEVIRSSLYDAVHICTAVDQHGPQCVQAMQAGLHCASAVPMGLTLDELTQVVAAQRQHRVNYMMMETAIYSAELLYAKALRDRGEFGRIQYLQGYHSQDLTGYPTVWRGFPPMWYITHALAPLLDIVDGTASRVHCLGSGVATEGQSTAWYSQPFPIASALFRLRDSRITAEITRTLFDVAPYGGEGFNIWGETKTLTTAGQSLETTLSPVLPGKQRSSSQKIPDIRLRADLLPPEMHPFSDSGHSGSHPHLINEFISSIVQGRPPYIDAVKAANWCAPGICAHQSMLKDGEGVAIPRFT